MKRKKLTVGQMAACALAGVIALTGVLLIAAMAQGGSSPSAEGQDPGAMQPLVDDSLVRITYTGSGEAAGVAGAATVNFRIENLSDQEFTVYPVDSYVNDTAVLLTSGVPATVAPGKSYVYPWVLSYAAIGIESYGDLKDLETGFEIMAEDGSVLEELGPFTVEFTQN